MGLIKTRGALIACFLCASVLLQGCGNENTASKPVEIKAAPKLTNDATTYAHTAWELVNQVDALVYNKQLDAIEDQVRKPVRKLSTDWRVNVKMTDSVTEGKYALCRKALTSLEIWARVTAEGNPADQKQMDYERDKQQCSNALDHPELGNTDPKKVGI